MTLEIGLLILRSIAGILLLAFLITLFVMLWRDLRVISQEVNSRTKRRGQLVVTKSENPAVKPGTVYPLLPLTSLGRAPTNTIRLNDAFTSSEHALVTLRSGQWWLEDRESSNGTLLNGEPIFQPLVIATGDLIGVGQVELRLELE